MEYDRKRGIKIIHSTPYYLHANNQTEATNKIVKNIIEIIVDEETTQVAWSLVHGILGNQNFKTFKYWDYPLYPNLWAWWGFAHESGGSITSMAI